MGQTGLERFLNKKRKYFIIQVPHDSELKVHNFSYLRYGG